MTARLLVIAVGNPGRGDDSLGPRLLGRVREHLQVCGCVRVGVCGTDEWALQGLVDQSGPCAQVELIEEFQLQIEHCLDLQSRERVVFIDAGIGTRAPYSCEPVVEAAEAGVSSHALTPAQVLAVYRRVLGHAPPASWLLCVRGECFELSEDLSEPARERMEKAWTWLRDVVDECLASSSPSRGPG